MNKNYGLFVWAFKKLKHDENGVVMCVRNGLLQKLIKLSGVTLADARERFVNNII